MGVILYKEVGAPGVLILVNFYCFLLFFFLMFLFFNFVCEARASPLERFVELHSVWPIIWTLFHMPWACNHEKVFLSLACTQVSGYTQHRWRIYRWTASFMLQIAFLKFADQRTRYTYQFSMDVKQCDTEYNLEWGYF